MYLPSTRTMLNYAKKSVVIAMCICAFSNTTVGAYIGISPQAEDSKEIHLTGNASDILEESSEPPDDDKVATDNFVDNFDLDKSFTPEEEERVNAALKLINKDVKATQRIVKMVRGNSKKIYIMRAEEEGVLKNNCYVSAEDIAADKQYADKLGYHCLNDNVGIIVCNPTEKVFYPKIGADIDNYKKYVNSYGGNVEDLAAMLRHELEHAIHDYETNYYTSGTRSPEVKAAAEKRAIREANTLRVILGKPESQRGRYQDSMTEEHYKWKIKNLELERQLAELNAILENEGVSTVKEQSVIVTPPDTPAAKNNNPPHGRSDI